MTTFWIIITVLAIFILIVTNALTDDDNIGGRIFSTVLACVCAAMLGIICTLSTVERTVDMVVDEIKQHKNESYIQPTQTENSIEIDSITVYSHKIKQQ